MSRPAVPHAVARGPVARGQRGQATPLVAMVLLMAALLLIPTGVLIRAAVHRAEAQSAADAAALAGALEGEEAARAVAADNDAVVVAFARSGDVVEVTVVVHDREATARARRDLVRRRSPQRPD